MAYPYAAFVEGWSRSINPRKEVRAGGHNTPLAGKPERGVAAMI
jgi:hypothetical protein